MDYIPPSIFLTKILGIASPYDWQIEALQAVRFGKDALGGLRTAIVAPNGSGKTSNVIAPAILYFLTLFPRGQVPVTSSSFMQVRHQIFPALRAYLRRPFFAGWTSTQMEVRTPEGGLALGFSTDDAGRAEGWHPKISPEEDPVLYVLDEAKSIPDEIFEAASRCTLHHCIIASSPGRDSGYFYDCFHAKRRFYHKIQVTYEMCPHIERNDPGKKERMLAELGENSPLYRSSILGEFTDLDGAGMIKREWVAKARALDGTFWRNTGKRSGGMDFAAGGDENVLAVMDGNKLFVADHWKNPDTVAARGRFMNASRAWGLRPRAIFADGDGLGIPIIDDMRAVGFDVMSYRGGEKAANENYYANMRAESWHQFGRALEKGEVLLEIDDETAEQLVAPRVEFDVKGRLKLESKEDMRKRGVSSPDRADALIMAWRAGMYAMTAEVAPSLNKRIRDAGRRRSRY